MTRRWRFLPAGLLDLILQIAGFMTAYGLYSYTRGRADGPGVAERAFANARSFYAFEESLGLNFERPLQQAADKVPHLLDIASFIYLNAQTTVSFGALIFIYIFHNRSYGFVRNMFLVGWMIAIAGYTFVPTAPPRLIPELGIFDAVQRYTGIDPQESQVGRFFNLYAAVPSMHVGFALMIGIPLARLTKFKAAKVFWLIYPWIIIFVVVSTGHHFLIDAVFGAMAVGLAALAATMLSRLRPADWRFKPADAAP